MNRSTKPLIDYPRPQLVRSSYLCLNGEWEYAIRKDKKVPDTFDGKIMVPFSPETELSGVNRTLQPDERLYYRLKFSLDKSFIKDKVILHFMGVDQLADVYLNDAHLGLHVGGYLPFEFDIKPFLEQENVLLVKVRDMTDTSHFSRGKQKIKRGGIWYTPQSGIYMPVWLESVSNDYIKELRITPDVDNSEIRINVISDAPGATIKIFGKEKAIPTNEEVSYYVENPHLWSPEDPFLYRFSVKTKGDEVTSYFAMRKVSTMMYNGHKVIALNNKPYFMKGVLDQGYYKGGLYTPESYQDYVSDLGLIKSLGFNTVRKHIKIEMPRWYYECDRMGLLVWQDFINGGGKYKASIVLKPLITGKHKKDNRYSAFGRNDMEGRIEAKQEFRDIINYLYNTPSIVLWTIFNEGWGQFDAKDIYYGLRDLDKTRLFDHASGWHDQGVSDVKSLHVYFKKVKMPSASKVKNRAVVISEFGGLVLPIRDHMRKGKQTYKVYKNTDKWLDAYEKMIDRDIIKNIRKGLTASIYTQLSDVEDELNGFVTFDRQVVKCSVEKIKTINDKIKFE